MIQPDEIIGTDVHRPSPSVGRIVHYYAGEPNPEAPAPMAAIVTGRAPNGMLCLTVFAINGSFLTEASSGGPDGDTPAQGCWNWPPRV